MNREARAWLAVLAVLAVLVSALVACHSEAVIPFMDAGDPCSAPNHVVDCANYADTTCGMASTSCPRLLYGCADAEAFSHEDYSECPPEGGAGDGGSDASGLGDVSFLSDTGTAGDAGSDGEPE